MLAIRIAWFTTNALTGIWMGCTMFASMVEATEKIKGFGKRLVSKVTPERLKPLTSSEEKMTWIVGVCSFVMIGSVVWLMFCPPAQKVVEETEEKRFWRVYDLKDELEREK